MILLLDFDHTLFDSERFKQALGFETIDEKNFFIKAWNLVRLGAMRHNLAEFLFPDTIPFLEKHHKDTRILITHGVPIFQKLKVARSRLPKYLDRMYFTGSVLKGDRMRLQFMDEQLKKPVIFLDDRAYQLENMCARCPGVFSVRMRRKEGKYDREETPKGCREVKDLEEFSDLLQKLETKNL